MNKFKTTILINALILSFGVQASTKEVVSSQISDEKAVAMTEQNQIYVAQKPSFDERAVNNTYYNSRNIPLSRKDAAALKYAKQWIKAKTYPYKDNEKTIYLFSSGEPSLICSPFRVCMIYLEPGEKIVKNGVQLGDSVRWNISYAIGAGDQMQLIVKPVDVGLSTTLAVITDRRTYYIKLLSRSKDYMPGIAFAYPQNIAKDYYLVEQENQQKQINNTMPNGVNIENLDFNYYIDPCLSCDDIKPVRVYNDGKQVVIDMPENISSEEVPSLLVVTSQGNGLVNYRFKNNQYIVDRLFKEAVLIRGVGFDQQKVTIYYSGGNSGKSIKQLTSETQTKIQRHKRDK